MLTEVFPKWLKMKPSKDDRRVEKEATCRRVEYLGVGS